jgi:hypothetical protein
MNIKQYSALLSGIVFSFTLMGCKKDKTPISSPKPETSKWELISGTYKVYDTTGVYLYDMGIEHYSGLDGNGNRRDTLHFMNFDGQFDFFQQQSYQPSNWPRNFLSIGSHYPIKDSSDNRWRVTGFHDLVYNVYTNDTIFLWFEKNNILYYIEDVIPYFGNMCYQIAIKQ